MRQVDKAFDLLFKRWSSDRLVCVGFRDDLTDVARWVAYCLNNRPVKYELFNRMVTEEVPLPKYSSAEVIAAWKWMADQLPDDTLNVELVERLLTAADKRHR